MLELIKKQISRELQKDTVLVTDESSSPPRPLSSDSLMQKAKDQPSPGRE